MAFATRMALAIALLAGFAGTGQAAGIVTIPQSDLTPSTNYYTDTIGGGIGSVVVMTGGGNANGAGDPSGRNDDGFSGPINLGFTLPFFGTNYTQFWANNNGNISFNGGIAAYTPQGPTGANEPIISPWFGDVDTRDSASGVLHIRTDIPNEVILTWDKVGYFDAHGDKLDSFQLVVRGPNYDVPNGEGRIGFFYKDMQWEAADLTTTAAVGFGDGQGNGEVLQGSIEAGLNAAVANHHIWFDPNLTPIPPTVPEPASMVLLGLGISAICLVGRSRRHRKPIA